MTALVSVCALGAVIGFVLGFVAAFACVAAALRGKRGAQLVQAATIVASRARLRRDAQQRKAA